jgi:aminomethyltransferase
VTQLVFMTGNYFDWQGHALYITRSGYTGEDGFEISCPAKLPKPLPKSAGTAEVAPSAWARATRCALKPDFACTATT